MKVCFIYREKRPTGFSIEEVFSNIRKAISPKVTQLEYVLNGNKSTIWNIIQIRKIKADIYHITGDCNYIGIGLLGKKTLLTVHDIGHLVNTLSGFKKLIYRLIWWDFPLRLISRITAVSSFTKQSLEKTFGEKVASKTTVIYNPLANGFTHDNKSELNSKTTIIQIGSGRNKNIHRLIEAATQLNVKLLLIREPDAQLEAQLNQCKIEFEWYTRVDSAKLTELYRQSDIVYFASTYEGFGLPIIEAQAMGRPVITSNTCSMPEVAGHINTLVDPNNSKEICDKIIYLQSKVAWDNEVKLGTKNIERFDASRIASLYYKTYVAMINE